MNLMDIKEFFGDIFKYILIAVILIIIFIYVISLQQIVGISMSPTLEDGDVAVLNKIEYKFFDIKRNDVVSLNYDDSKYLIKRVVGLPGEKIEYKNNDLYVNGQRHNEMFLYNDIITKDFSVKNLGYDVIPDDMYLVLGDNRTDSLDSRKIGLIKKEDIKGKVFLKIWPLNKISFVK